MPQNKKLHTIVSKYLEIRGSLPHFIDTIENPERLQTWEPSQEQLLAATREGQSDGARRVEMFEEMLKEQNTFLAGDISEEQRSAAMLVKEHLLQQIQEELHRTNDEFIFRKRRQQLAQSELDAVGSGYMDMAGSLFGSLAETAVASYAAASVAAPAAGAATVAAAPTGPAAPVIGFGAGLLAAIGAGASTRSLTAAANATISKKLPLAVKKAIAEGREKDIVQHEDANGNITYSVKADAQEVWDAGMAGATKGAISGLTGGLFDMGGDITQETFSKVFDNTSWDFSGSGLLDNPNQVAELAETGWFQDMQALFPNIPEDEISDVIDKVSKAMKLDQASELLHLDEAGQFVGKEMAAAGDLLGKGASAVAEGASAIANEIPLDQDGTLTEVEADIMGAGIKGGIDQSLDSTEHAKRVKGANITIAMTLAWLNTLKSLGIEIDDTVLETMINDIVQWGTEGSAKSLIELFNKKASSMGDAVLLAQVAQVQAGLPDKDAEPVMWAEKKLGLARKFYALEEFLIAKENCAQVTGELLKEPLLSIEEAKYTELQKKAMTLEDKIKDKLASI